MTGYEILKRAADLLGYRDAAGDEDLDTGTKKSAHEYLNRVLFDIAFIGNKEYTPISSLEEETGDFSPAEQEAIIYGLCMWLSFSVSDGEKNSVFTHLYNSRRTALTRTAQIKDTIPNPEG